MMVASLASVMMIEPKEPLLGWMPANADPVAAGGHDDFVIHFQFNNGNPADSREADNQCSCHLEPVRRRNLMAAPSE